MMSIAGYTDYKRREYCNDIKCTRQLEMNEQEDGSAEYERLRHLCKTECLHTTYEFHHWLIEKGYLVVKLEEKEQDARGKISAQGGPASGGQETKKLQIPIVKTLKFVNKIFWH